MKWFKKTITRRVVWMPIAGGIILLLLVQIFWPSSKVLPFTYWGDQPISAKSVSDVKNLCQDQTKEAKIVVAAEMGELKSIITPSDISTQFNCEQFANSAARYPFVKKIIPLSLLVRHAVQSPRLAVNNQDEFSKKVQDVAKRLIVPAQNAQLLIENGKIVEKDAVAGVSYNEQNLAPQLLAIEWPQLQDSIMYGEKTQASISKNDLADVKKEIEARVSAGFTFVYNKKKHPVAAEKVGLWLSVKTLGSEKPEILYHPEAVEKYINDNVKTLQKELGMKSIDSAQSGKAVIAALQKATPEATLLEVSVDGSKAPIAASPDSITAFISSLAAKGESVGLYVKKIGGGTQYGTNADRVYTSASTYKLFVAYSVMRRVDAGELAWSSPINGTTVAACFEKMIVVSDNACPEAFLQRFGFSTVQAEARSIGASQASFSPGNMRISAQSLGVMLEKLHGGSLVSASSRERLLGLMRRQVYRRGIPAGTSYQVADKVGFLYALLHDAAVIETPQGNYVVVIMTDGSSWGRIAELTRMIASTL